MWPDALDVTGVWSEMHKVGQVEWLWVGREGWRECMKNEEKEVDAEYGEKNRQMMYASTA